MKAENDFAIADMEATLCAVLMKNGSRVCFNVGYSRAYRINPKGIEQINVDNTEGKRLYNLGLLDEKELETFPKRKAIYKYIGNSVKLVLDIYKIEGLKQGV